MSGVLSQPVKFHIAINCVARTSCAAMIATELKKKPDFMIHLPGKTVRNSSNTSICKSKLVRFVTKYTSHSDSILGGVSSVRLRGSPVLIPVNKGGGGGGVTSPSTSQAGD